MNYEAKLSRSVGNEYVHIDEYIDHYWMREVEKKELTRTRDVDEAVHKLVH